ncbi:2'-5' RNA ligase family protein [bacterium]|nr:2'-5' RNA ligase family protein [bacterium]
MDQFSTQFIIITVPKGIVFRKFSSMINLVEHVGETYTAASYPPHVTLRTGAIVPIKEIDSFISKFEHHICDWNSFDMETDGIINEEYTKHGEQKFFIYYHIRENCALNQLNRHLLEFTPFIKSQKKTFCPHLSLAYKDLSQRGYEKIRDLIASKSQLFPEKIKWRCDNVSLFYWKNFKWVPYHVFHSVDSIKS